MTAPIKRHLKLRGAAGVLMTTREKEGIISGSAGTGKSLACLVRLYADVLGTPDRRALIVRKTRTALTDGALVTFERDVIDRQYIGNVTRAGRRSYRFPNGSEIVVGGLDKEGKVMSQDWDFIYAQEAIELAESEWEILGSRIGRTGQPGFLYGCTNPDKPTHWLKVRCDHGKTMLLESRHEDNPILWDGHNWTEAARNERKDGYLDRLDMLTGTRLLRLRYGRWVQAEGVVYDGWDAAVHLIDRFEIPASWPRYRAVDFGFTNPLVFQWWAEDPDGRLFMYREIYHTQKLVEDVARQVKAIDATHHEPRAMEIVCDHDAEGRATLERHLVVNTTPAIKNIQSGIQAVAGRLRVTGDGKPRLFILRDSLVDRDASLEERKLPTCTVAEFDGYVWSTAQGRKKGEEPVDKDNHGMDCVRYLCAHLDTQRTGGWVPTSQPAKSNAVPQSLGGGRW